MTTCKNQLPENYVNGGRSFSKIFDNFNTAKNDVDLSSILSEIQ